MYKLRYVAVALVAGTVGAAVALLLAPDTGRNTRRKVMRRLQREREMRSRSSSGPEERNRSARVSRLEVGARSVCHQDSFDEPPDCVEYLMCAVAVRGMPASR